MCTIRSWVPLLFLNPVWPYGIFAPYKVEDFFPSPWALLVWKSETFLWVLFFFFLHSFSLLSIHFFLATYFLPWFLVVSSMKTTSISTLSRDFYSHSFPTFGFLFPLGCLTGLQLSLTTSEFVVKPAPISVAFSHLRLSQCKELKKRYLKGPWWSVDRESWSCPRPWFTAPGS